MQSQEVSTSLKKSHDNGLVEASCKNTQRRKGKVHAFFFKKKILVFQISPTDKAIYKGKYFGLSAVYYQLQVSSLRQLTYLLLKYCDIISGISVTITFLGCHLSLVVLGLTIHSTFPTQEVGSKYTSIYNGRF